MANRVPYNDVGQEVYYIRVCKNEEIFWELLYYMPIGTNILLITRSYAYIPPFKIKSY